MTEIFKDIQGYEGLYQISNLGRVKSLPKGNGNGGKERMLKLEVIKNNHTNYHRVTLSKNGNTKRFQVHRLVAQHFIPNMAEKPFVNHIDNNGTNNNYINLEWCTAAENMLHSSNQNRQDEARSLGGKAATAKRYAENTVKYAEMVGSKYGSLTVLSFYLDTSGVNSRTKFKCKCACGNVTEKGLDKLTSGVQACKECTYKIRSQTRKNKSR